MFLTQYPYNLCFPTMFLEFRVYIALCHAGIFFWLILEFSHLIRAVRKIETSVKFISVNHFYSMTTIFSRNNVTISLNLWSDYLSIMFHQSSHLTNNLLNMCILIKENVFGMVLHLTFSCSSQQIFSSYKIGLQWHCLGINIQ